MLPKRWFFRAMIIWLPKKQFKTNVSSAKSSLSKDNTLKLKCTQSSSHRLVNSHLLFETLSQTPHSISVTFKNRKVLRCRQIEKCTSKDWERITASWKKNSNTDTSQCGFSKSSGPGCSDVRAQTTLNPNRNPSLFSSLEKPEVHLCYHWEIERRTTESTNEMKI